MTTTTALAVERFAVTWRMAVRTSAFVRRLHVRKSVHSPTALCGQSLDGAHQAHRRDLGQVRECKRCAQSIENGRIERLRKGGENDGE